MKETSIPYLVETDTGYTWRRRMPRDIAAALSTKGITRAEVKLATGTDDFELATLIANALTKRFDEWVEEWRARRRAAMEEEVPLELRWPVNQALGRLDKVLSSLPE